MFVASVWHPYQVQAPFTVGLVGVLCVELEIEVEIRSLVIEVPSTVVEVGVLITLPADTTTIVTGMHGFIGSNAK